MVNPESMSNGQVEWNMASLLNIELSRLRTNANTYFISGKYREAIDTLIVMKMTGIHVFTKEERDAIKILELELLSSLLNYSGLNSFNIGNYAEAKKSLIKIRKIFPEYNEKLMDTLHAHGFLGNYKRDSGKMNI
jgi:tetratricopeptide (TPR) repeat protein